MNLQFVHRAMLVTLLICQCSICLATEVPDTNKNTKYLDAVHEFADNVLKYGRDTYGPKHTPLFVDGLNIHTHEPVKWIDPDGTRWILSNLASQQNLFRTLDGLTRITGDPKYKQAAMDAIRYAFDNLRSPNGLLYWGLQDAYDAQKDVVYESGSHVFKSQHPYYELMWEVDPEATRQFIEAFWTAHIINWSNLDMNRIGRPFSAFLEEPWDHEYTGGPVFFESQGRSFLVTGGDLFCAAGLLTKLSGEGKPLIWAKRLAHRYVETRNPRVGISGGSYTRKKVDAAEYQLGEDFKGHLVLQGTLVPSLPGVGDPDIRETILGFLMVTPGIECNYAISPWVSSILLGDILGNDGRDFVQWGLEELTALGKVAYRQQDNVWIPMLTDGTSLEGYVCKKDGALGWRGLEFKAIPAVNMDFWAYALAYRVTGDPFMWRMARSIALGLHLGDIGMSPETHPELKTTMDSWQPYALLAFLELHKKTGNQAFLQIARDIGDNLLVHRFHKGFFGPSNKHIYTKFDAIEPLALLHLYVVLKAKLQTIPIVWPGRSYFNVPYRYEQNIVVDNALYTLTDSLNLPRSLREVAKEGNLDEVKAMLARGANVNARDQLFACALHYACQQAHVEVAELLISKGARVDAGPNTPLHYAAAKGYPAVGSLSVLASRFPRAGKGHRDIVKLLISHGAHVNAKNEYGDTPLHCAAGIGHGNIIDLLIANGANVNAKNEAGQTPLHYAVEDGHRDIIELLLAKGADVNVKSGSGQTPVDIAISRNRKDIVELLIANGADVSLRTAVRFGDLAIVKSLIGKGADIKAKDASGRTALHYAVEESHKDIVELLIANGADVNAENNDGDTPAHVALGESKISILVLLIEKGANLDSIQLAARKGDLDRVKSFIEKGVGVNTTDSYGATPLHYAAVRGSKEVVEFLIARCADVNVKKKSGDTPLHGAAISGNKDVVELLIDNAANVNARGRWDYTPIYYAAWSGVTEVVELLVEKGADVNVKDRWGWTPLHYAADGNKRGMTELLITKGADVNTKDNSGKTVLSVAREKGHTEIVELLRKHGAKD